MITRSKLSLKAFSLVEIVVAAMILAVTVAGVFSVFTSGNRFIFRASRRLSAVNIAQGEIEKRRQYVRFDTWANANDGVNLGRNDPAWTGEIALDLVDLLPDGKYQYTVADDPDPGNPVPALPLGQACRRVYMRVLWNEPRP